MVILKQPCVMSYTLVLSPTAHGGETFVLLVLNIKLSCFEHSGRN